MSSGNRNPRIFVGFPYCEPYVCRYGTMAASAIRACGWDPAMPLGEVPQGILLDRITTMIGGSDCAVYEVGPANGNVSFELGISIALRQPVALMSDRDPVELPDLLRTPWLCFYTDDDACIAALNGFLGLENLSPLVSGQGAPGDPELVVVVGAGDRARALARGLRASGRSVVRRRPSTIRSPAEAAQVAESCGALVVVRPEASAWDGVEATPALISLGVSFGLNRTAIIAAGAAEKIPSDCMPLVARGTDDPDISANVIELIDKPMRPLPPSGTSRPRADASLARTLRTVVANELHTHGRALLSAEPGYGKTTLLRQVADELGCATAWVTIESNWSVAQLIERIVASIGQHIPQFGWQAWAAVQRSRQTAEQPEIGLATRQGPHPAQLAELLARHEDITATGQVLLAIDDVHNATSEGAQLLAQFAQCSPSWLRLILAGRGAPSELRSATAAGHIPCWTAEELRFSRVETGEFLRHSIPTLDDERANRIHECSDGWPAALAVIRAWLAANEDATIETLTEMTRGDRHRIYQLFAADYFAQLPEHIQGDLLLCSLPLRLDVSVAQRLLGADGGMRLRELVDGPYFISEAEVGIFHLHSLFREFLSQRWIDERGSDSLQAAQSEIAKWYQDRDDPVSAYQIACEGEDWETATKAIEPFVRTFANEGDAGFLRDLLSPLPIERIRETWLIRESWVRALAASGAAEALEEARGLVDAAAPSIADQALAELVLAELEHNRGHLSGAAMADACNRIAQRLIGHDASLSLSARLLSIDARRVGNADPTAWPNLLAEARELSAEAENEGVLAVAAGASSAAADLASRTFQSELRSAEMQLRIIENFGGELPLMERVESAKYFIACSNDVIDLFQNAFRLAEAAEAPLALARVRIDYARFLVLNSGLATIRSGDADESAREQANTALQLALGAAETYSDFGVPREVVIALNVAAEAASVLGDRERITGLTVEASRIARQFEYSDLAATAERIADGPTVPDRHRQARNRTPFSRQSPAQLNEVVEEIIRASRVTLPQAQRVRPLLRREVTDLATLEANQENVCQYLALLRDLTGPRIGPFLANLRWSLTCRMRGISSISRNDRAEPLLRQFIEGICEECNFRSPGQTNTNIGDDEEIYAPLGQRLASESKRNTDG